MMQIHQSLQALSSYSLKIPQKAPYFSITSLFPLNKMYSCSKNLFQPF
uniref:Uncharacterized protein n=1 Tax=Arundo donax TaxID=35708 RepID=A0A0A9DVU2_ARUDO